MGTREMRPCILHAVTQRLLACDARRIEPHASTAAMVYLPIRETASRACARCALRGADAGRIGRGGRRPDADVGCAVGGVCCDERKGAPAVPLS